jgi:hypothetical protein
MSVLPLTTPGPKLGAAGAPDAPMPAIPVRLLAVLLALVSILAPSAISAAEAFAVLPVSEPPGPDAALIGLAAEVRVALERRGVGVLGPLALRDRMTGSAPAEMLAATQAAYEAALETHARGDFEGSIRALRALIAELEFLPAGAQVHAQWQRAMLRVARAEQAVGRRGDAQAVLQRLLRVDPAVEVDARLYPPGFQRLVDEVRAETRALWTRKLTVESQPGVQVLLEGRDAGSAPLVLELPPGRYRISGALGGIRSRSTTVDLSGEDRRVELDLSIAEVLRPDAGPGFALAQGAPPGRVIAAGSFLDLDRLVAVRIGAEGGAVYLAASIHDARRGTSMPEGRVALTDGELPPGGADALAAHLLTGEASPLVTVVPVADLRPVLPPLVAPTPVWSWDGVSRPEARKYGWWATGTAAAAVALTGVAVWQSSVARGAYGDATGMLDENGEVAYGHTVTEYNDAIARGDRAGKVATGSAIGAAAFAVGAVVLGVVSHHRTGEIGPIRF